MIRFCQRYAMAPADVTRREPGAARQWVRIVRSGWKLSVRPLTSVRPLNYRAPSAELLVTIVRLPSGMWCVEARAVSRSQRYGGRTSYELLDKRLDIQRAF